MENPNKVLHKLRSCYNKAHHFAMQYLERNKKPMKCSQPGKPKVKSSRYIFNDQSIVLIIGMFWFWFKVMWKVLILS